jgi:hypothetical protein
MAKSDEVSKQALFLSSPQGFEVCLDRRADYESSSESRGEMQLGVTVECVDRKAVALLELIG